ncbi:MAG: universal stress protein [Chloroflexi bacterium]|nr:universal stress protein [Chloroflexota bacterium]
MFKKILVPLDGTADSERVLDWVKPFAVLGAELHLVTVVDSRHRADAQDIDNLSGSISELAERYLHGLLDRVRKEFPSTQATIGTGRPAFEILRIASKVNADLIAMESHRSSAFMRGILGSCTDAVVRAGRLPVLVLPPGAADVKAPDKPGTVLVPLDGSELAERALTVAVEMARDFQAELALLRSMSSSVYGAGAYGVDASLAWDKAIEFQAQESAAYLEDHADRVREDVPSVRIAVSTATGAAGVLEAMEGSPSTLTVMVTHGRGGFRRLMLGSVTDKVVRSGHAPVLVLPARYKAGAPDLPGEVMVSDVMSSPAITTNGDTTLGHAARLMVENHIGALPVVDESGAIIGIITESLFLPTEQHVPFSRDPIFKVFDQSVGGAKGLKDALEALRDRPVREIMLEGRATVPEDAPLTEAAALMMRDAITHVPVLKDDVVVGIVAVHDLLRLIAEDGD